MTYFVWSSRYMKGLCALEALEGVDDEFELHKGMPRAQGWPIDACCGMRSQYPKDIEVPDNVYGAYHIVVSSRLREIVQAASANRIEFLPITIKNHKQRIASTTHCVLNALDVCDCIDIQRSGVSWNDLDPTEIATVDNLVLREGAIPPEYTIFRPKHWQTLTIAREDVVTKLTQAKLTGLMFQDVQDFTG